jgi:hypothetical protein
MTIPDRRALMLLVFFLGACGTDTAPDSSDDTVFSDGADAPDTSTSNCLDSASCDDGFPCTVDACKQGACSWSIADDVCFINGSCRAEGDTLDCGICAPSLSASSWSSAPNGTPCEDTDPCTESGFCANGSCEVSPSECDDKNDCTADSCAPEAGCQNIFKASGTLCELGSVCFTDGTCADGSCSAPVISCDDGNECTADACDPVSGCVNTPIEALCNDGDACTGDGTCSNGVCTAGESLPCSDGNSCTIDSCHPSDGCSHLEVFSPCCTGLVSVCDDGNPCTNDECDPVTKDCSYENNYLACDDGDACTTSDSCGGATCQGQSIDCSDGNPCTLDQCAPDTGCSHVPTSGVPCDDGLQCSTGDACLDGECAGDTTDCVCVPTFYPTASKLTSIALGEGGYVGEGLDIDGNPATCAPSDSCSDGIDNAFAALSEVAEAVAGVAINDEMAANTKAGWVMLVVELRNINGNDLELAIYQAGLDPANAGCKFQKTTCSYWATADMLDEETCQPSVLLPATLIGTKISAGGPGTKLPFEIPFQGGIMLKIVLYDLSFEGSVDLANDEVVSLTGILGAAIPKEDLESAILALPADALGGIDPEAALPLLSLALEYDITVPGKGPAASIGLKLGGIGATLTGVQP